MAFISVTDTGVGILPEDLDKIFDRYYRVSGKDKHQSSGLGLAIAQEIIQQHNGKITVKSNIGKGTVFTLQLPVIPQ
ncbi:Alkaline phosphatase synthesis sensor protein PhoR [anaerobic digester metagenome]